MRKYIFLAILFATFALGASAQSGMTDDQVIKFVMKEQSEGTSQAQIVTKLMQRGVDMQQIRRIRDKYDRDTKGGGLGNLPDKDDEDINSRLRMPNGKLRQSSTKILKEEQENGRRELNRRSAYRVRELPNKNAQVYYDESNEDWIRMQEELNTFVPDTAALLEQLLADREKDRRKVFGRDIFNNEELSFEPNMNIATPEDYRLGPGDAVFIDVYGASQKTVQSTVSPDGAVNIEGFGPVNVSGMTVAQANAHLRATLGARYSSSKVRLTVGQTKTIMVHVMGEVNTPGTYTLSAFATVFHALYMAGGTNDIGTLRNIKVYRQNRLVTVVDIYDYILNGQLTGNVRLADNDVIVVGPYDCLVNITGKVKRPMFYEMKKNESLGSLLKYAGGFAGDAYTKQVRLVRKTGREYSVHSVEEFDFSSFHLADQDSVSVDSVIDRYSNMVELKGAVFRPGMYEVGGQINSVRTLLERAEGVTEDAFTDHAVMHRMRSDRTLEVIAVDVNGIMSGTVPDIPLQPNDALFIPTKQDMTEEQTITIHGEVNFPGVYKYAANETLEDFVLQAGGLRQTASLMKVDVSRRIYNPKALRPDSVIAKTYSFALKDGFVIDGESGFVLQPFDEVYVRKSPDYTEQQNVEVVGEVIFEGTYTLSKRKTRLSDVINAAGGVNDMAYVKGARLERRINEAERIRMEEVLKKQREEAENNRLKAIATSENADALAKLNMAGAELTKYSIGKTYYVGIDLDKALANPGSDDDMELREGDKIIVPRYNGTVKINGEVMYPNTVTYENGKSAKHYINLAGGFSNEAKKKAAYIIYMNGKVAKVGRKAKPQPGCEIVVPKKVRNNMSTAEAISLGTGAASIATMIATIANVLK